MFGNCYFFVFKIQKINKDKALPPFVVKFVNRYLSRRFKKVQYFEPFTDKENATTAVILGSELVHQKANRNVLIFLLELYATFNDPQLVVTPDFKKTVKKLRDVEIEIYKFKKYKYKNETN